MSVESWLEFHQLAKGSSNMKYCVSQPSLVSGPVGWDVVIQTTVGLLITVVITVVNVPFQSLL